MAFNKPVKGERDWATKLNGTLDDLKERADGAQTTADSATSIAEGAQSVAAAAETPAGAQAKADSALVQANLYTDSEVAAEVTRADGKYETPAGAQAKVDALDASVDAALALKLDSATAGATYLTQADGARKDQTPSLDELATGWNLGISVTTAVSYPIFIAPYPLSVEQFAMCTFGAAIPASDAAYWTVELRRVRNNVTVVIATKTSKATTTPGVPGEAIPARGGWNFDQATFDAANKQLLKDDIVSVAFIPTGAVTNLGFPSGSLRYVPSA